MQCPCVQHAVVVRQGEVGNEFFITLQGSMSVHVDKALSSRKHRSSISSSSLSPDTVDLMRLGKCVAVIMRGDAFGEQALLDKNGGFRMSTVVTRELT